MVCLIPLIELGGMEVSTIQTQPLKCVVLCPDPTLTQGKRPCDYWVHLFAVLSHQYQADDYMLA